MKERCPGWGGGCSYYRRNDSVYCTDCLMASLRAELATVTAERDAARKAERAYDDLVGDLDPPDILVHWLNDRRLLAETKAALEQVKDQCNRQEHGFARREGALQGELVASRTETAAATARLTSVRSKLRAQLEQTGMPDADGEGPSNATLETWAVLVQTVADLVYDADSELGSCPGCEAATARIAELEEYLSRPPSAHEQRLNELRGSLTLEQARHADTTATLKYASDKMGAAETALRDLRERVEMVAQEALGSNDAVDPAFLMRLIRGQ